MSAHGLVGERRKNAWLCRNRVPPFYSNLIALDADLGDDASLVAEVDSAVARPWSIKDSYRTLALRDVGFDVLFDAEWFMRPSVWNSASRADRDRPVRTVGSQAELSRWIDAWGETPAGRDVFRPEILDNRDVEFLYVEDDRHILAGLVANRSDDVVGITNAFGDPRGILSCIDGVSSRHGLTIVGYGQRRQLEFLSRFGFQAIGELRIWLRN